MSDVVDITQLTKNFKTTAERQKFIEKQHETITQLMQRNATLEAEVAHLKELLSSTTQVFGEKAVEKVIVTPEEHLIESQLNMLQARGLDRELSSDDVKKLDILLKNKNMIKGEKKVIEADFKKVPQLSKEELVKIALMKKPDGS